MAKDGYTLMPYSPCSGQGICKFQWKTYEYHDGAWILAHITAKVSAWHYMHNFQFEVDFSTTNFRQKLDRPELITMNLTAELSGPVLDRDPQC